MIVSLSREYLSFSREAEKPDCPSPALDPIVFESQREGVARALSVGFKALMAKPPRAKRKGA